MDSLIFLSFLSYFPPLCLLGLLHGIFFTINFPIILKRTLWSSFENSLRERGQIGGFCSNPGEQSQWLGLRGVGWSCWEVLDFLISYVPFTCTLTATKLQEGGSTELFIKWVTSQHSYTLPKDVRCLYATKLPAMCHFKEFD